MPTKKTIFLLEDDDAFTVIFRRWLEDEGYRVLAAKNVAEAKKLIDDEAPSLFWLDYYLGKDSRETGMDFFQWLKLQDKFKNIPALIISITADPDKFKKFKEDGIKKAFSKADTNRAAIIAYIKELIGV